MKKIRLSYTLLTLWDRGAFDDVVSTYFHMKTPRSEAVQKGLDRGKKFHEDIEQDILKFKAFPDWFFSYELKDPETEKEVVVEYNDMFDIKGIFDCVDETTLFEFKTGVANSLHWARTWQLPIYFLLAELAKIPIERAIVIRYDGKQSDFCVVHNTKAKREMAQNVIDSIGPDIYNYFEQEGLL